MQAKKQPASGGGKPHAKHGRNQKRQQHATHEAGAQGGGGHQRARQGGQANQSAVYVACKLCHQELQDFEKEFFPCNCKYKVCRQCFLHRVDQQDGKCPNCGLLYEVKRVREMYDSKANQVQLPNQLPSNQSARQKRYESPQPLLSPANSLAQGMSSSMSHNPVQLQGPAQKSQHQKPPQVQSNPQEKGQYGKQKANAKTQARQANNNLKNSQRSGKTTDPQSVAGQSVNLAASGQEKLSAGNRAQQSAKQKDLTQLNAANAKGGQSQGQTPAIAGSSGPSQKIQLAAETKQGKKQRNSSEQQRLQQKLSQVRILQRNTLYVIGLSPNSAKEETLRRYEYFGQYGRIQTVSVNKEKAFQSENQGLCYSAYINFASERDASLAILAVDQFVFDGRLLHASYGRTKYCRFFLKGTNCLNHECPYLHKESLPENILTQEDMNKKILFQQCQQLALKLSKLTAHTEDQFRTSLKAHKDTTMRALKVAHVPRIVMPQLEQIFEKKGLFKQCIQPGRAVGITTSGTAQPPTLTQTQNVPQSNNQQTTAALPQSLVPTGTVQSHQVPLSPQQQFVTGQVHPQNQHLVYALSGSLAPPNQNVNGGQKTNNNAQEMLPPTAQARRSAFGQHRGSEGCNSELMAPSNNMMLMFKGRNRLQSSGTLGVELDFTNKNSTGAFAPSRWQQLVPHGAHQDNRRVAHDDHYLTRLPANYRLVAGYPQQDSSTTVNFSNQQITAAGRAQPRFGSPKPQPSPLYFNQQFMASSRQQQNQLSNTKVTAPQPLNRSSTNLTVFSKLHDSERATQQSSGPLQAAGGKLGQSHHISQVYPHRHNLSQAGPGAGEARARSGSQANAALGQQFEEAKVPERRRKSSHGKFRIFAEPRKESPSPGNKEEQKRFAEALRNALQQFVKGDTAHEGGSTGQYSSIFAAGDPSGYTNRINLIANNNCSEGVVGGHACSPIRDSILYSRRNSQDYGTLTRPRSQHSLIVESVARILDDTALGEQRGGDREKQRFHHQPLNEPNFKTGPPSEVHQLMHEEQTMALNSHFYADMESKWNNQFDMTSSNSLNLTNPAGLGGSAYPHANLGQHKQPQVQKSQGAMEANQQTTRISGSNQQNYQTFTSPNMNASAGVWNQSGSFYNSHFLIPTHTQNQMHRSAAFHDNSLRHLPSQGNPFSQGPQSQTMRTHVNQGMLNDTWRITYNPHPPLLPSGPPGHSSAISSGGHPPMFKTSKLKPDTTTRSDMNEDRLALNQQQVQQQASGNQAPMLSRTTSMPFMMRSEQKVSRAMAVPQKRRNSLHRGQPAHPNLEISSQMKQAQLTQQNLEILNKKYCPSKDMLYAKIFTDYRPSSPTNGAQGTKQVSSSFGGKPQHPASANHYITPQSLFCFALDGDESTELRQTHLRNLNLTKQVSRDDAGGILSTPTRRKQEQHSFFFNNSSGHAIGHNPAKETSQTPTNKHSRAIGPNWKELQVSDVRSVNFSNPQNRSHGLLANNERDVVSTDEIEMANQLANEASLGFGDFFSMMKEKSKMSQRGDATRMSAVDAEYPPPRSRSQSYRDHPAAKGQPKIQQAESEHKSRKDHICKSNVSQRRDSDQSRGSSIDKTRTLKLKNQQQTSQGHTVASSATTGGAKNFYQEFVRVQEGFRKSSGLVASSAFDQSKAEPRRRSSYSQGRNSSTRHGIQLMEVTRRGSYKQGSQLYKRSRMLSPMGLLKIKNHQIDEVNEDGGTARDEVFDAADPASLRMNSADRQSYNLKTLKSVSRSRKASHSQNGNADY